MVQLRGGGSWATVVKFLCPPPLSIVSTLFAPHVFRFAHHGSLSFSQIPRRRHALPLFDFFFLKGWDDQKSGGEDGKECAARPVEQESVSHRKHARVT